MNRLDSLAGREPALVERAKRHVPAIAFTFLITLISLLASAAGDSDIHDRTSVLFREDFDNLKKWKPFYFPKIKEYSRYEVVSGPEGGVLAAISNSSASALVYEDEFDVYRYPRVRWRWKVRNVYVTGDASRKSGDDYPIRVYIMFRYNPKNAKLGERVKYRLAKAFYGEYPPHSSLNYIWANRKHQKRVLTSTYTEKSKMIILRWGTGEAGKWVDEEVDILRDYREAFGQDPPTRARIAIMNDSDNTGEASVSYVDYITVYR